jgi:hypothetical protein
LAFRLNEVNPNQLRYNINGVSNVPAGFNHREIVLQKFPVQFEYGTLKSRVTIFSTAVVEELPRKVMWKKNTKR